MSVKDLITFVKANENTCSLDCIEDMVYSHCKEKSIKEPVKVSNEQDVDKHRWYELATNVYKCKDGLVGVRGVSCLLSESMDYDDCCERSHATEYQAYTTTNYKEKEK